MRRKIILGLAVLVTSFALASPAGAANTVTSTSDGYCQVNVGSFGFVNGNPGVIANPADYLQGTGSFYGCAANITSVQFTYSMQNTNNGQSFTETPWLTFGTGPRDFCGGQGGPYPPYWTYGYECFSTQHSLSCLPRTNAINVYTGMTYRYWFTDNTASGWKQINDWQIHTCRA